MTTGLPRVIAVLVILLLAGSGDAGACPTWASLVRFDPVEAIRQAWATLCKRFYEERGPHVHLEYPALVMTIEETRRALGERYRDAHSEAERAQVITEARQFIVRTIDEDLLPRWSGTPWAFYGTTETPKVGTIACGYFVTTILRDAGFKVERVRLAQ